MKSVSPNERLVHISDGSRTSYFAVHSSGSGPSMLLLCDETVALPTLKNRIRLFAEEGYAVLGFKGKIKTADVLDATKTIAKRPECLGDPVCIVFGKVTIAAIKASKSFQAIAAFDATNLSKCIPAGEVTCPIVFQFGTKTGPKAANNVEIAKRLIVSQNGSRVYAWPEVAPGFSLPEHPSFDARVADLAHSRVLELIRRTVGPHYDYVALFAEHIHHEFETRNVDATMATMVQNPYVNHVATLAGGVGHDMLKRFYKYHFVEQNSQDRSSVTVSHTLGPDRVVIEMVVRFKHDQVLDRYFPGIPPTERYVELATVLIVKFRGDKVSHEHIYWDQGSALKQIGVLDADHLPIAGAEAARKVLDVQAPSNVFMEKAWMKSEGKPI